MDSKLAPHIRACLNLDFEDQELGVRDTGFSVCTLGTGSGTGTYYRSNPSSVLKSAGICYLVDAGEGIQRQFLTSRMNVRDIQKIFITHMHGDHIFGLPGLLLYLQVANVNSNTPRNIEIYGPVGLYNYLTTSLALSCSEIKKTRVDVYELHGGTQRSMRSGANRNTFNDFRNRGLFRHTIPQNADGTFTLVEPIEITSRDLAKHLGKPRGLSVKAAELDHVPQLQCFGYTFQEPFTQPRNIDAEKAKALGITEHIQLRELKLGFSVQSGDREILPEEVCESPPAPRKVTILGDCAVVPSPMERLARGSDVLVHEATLNMADKGRKVTLGGHSSAAEAALVANRCKAKVLVLNHLPAKIDNEGGVEDLWREANKYVHKDVTTVQVSYDHLEILIPRGGFSLK